jgi:hypothetical protein
MLEYVLSTAGLLAVAEFELIGNFADDSIEP